MKYHNIRSRILNMKQELSTTPGIPGTVNILLADDDVDDCYFFSRVLKSLPLQSQLTTVANGELLMTYLKKNYHNLPDLLFLDLNMPRKNGSECLLEIKKNEKLRHLPVIIYSTHLHEYDSDLFYNNGAHYYVRKSDMMELTKVLHRVLTTMLENKFDRPPKEKFMFTMETV